ncbi:MAG: AlbA family DNA-binding domain-containing protein [Myxococcales bacterium]
MPAFTPITTAAQLPQRGTAFERSVMDLKAAHEAGELFECAKDVAAFANALGGTILVGIKEDAGAVGDWAPLTTETADRAVSDYSQALDFCSPRPREVTPERITVGGGIIIAINVAPSPSQLIGVRHKSSQEHYRFPLRAGSHTIPIHPENLAMYMDARARRIVILLNAIPDGAQVEMTDIASTAALVGIQYHGPCSVDEMRNTATFPVGRVGSPRVVCLDDVSTVYEETSGHWVVGVRKAR